MSQAPFQKFVPKKKNSVIKEEFRQEKKKARKEKNEYFDKLKKEKYEARMVLRSGKPPVTKPDPVPVKKERSGNRQANNAAKAAAAETALMPLNKYLAHCGVCSRRDAVMLIKEGKVKVNGTLATEPGYKIK